MKEEDLGDLIGVDLDDYKTPNMAVIIIGIICLKQGKLKCSWTFS